MPGGESIGPDSVIRGALRRRPTRCRDFFRDLQGLSQSASGYRPPTSGSVQWLAEESEEKVQGACGCKADGARYSAGSHDSRSCPQSRNSGA